VSAVPLLLIFTISTFPSEWLEQKFQSAPVIGNLHNLLFAGEPDEATGRPSSWFSNRLITDQSFVDPDRLEKTAVSHSFRGRDLNYAVLNRSDLRKADFTGAKLNHAALIGAKLQDGCLKCAVGNASGCAELYGADLMAASLQGANIEGAQLQHASLPRIYRGPFWAMRSSLTRISMMHSSKVRISRLRSLNTRFWSMRSFKVRISLARSYKAQISAVRGSKARISSV
jgi:uncharacterized protein YjbI with pentapeptide repeats